MGRGQWRDAGQDHPQDKRIPPLGEVRPRSHWTYAHRLDELIEVEKSGTIDCVTMYLYYITSSVDVGIMGRYSPPLSEKAPVCMPRSISH